MSDWVRNPHFSLSRAAFHYATCTRDIKIVNIGLRMPDEACVRGSPMVPLVDNIQ